MTSSPVRGEINVEPTEKKFASSVRSGIVGLMLRPYAPDDAAPSGALDFYWALFLQRCRAYGAEVRQGLLPAPAGAASL